MFELKSQIVIGGKETPIHEDLSESALKIKNSVIVLEQPSDSSTSNLAAKVGSTLALI